MEFEEEMRQVHARLEIYSPERLKREGLALFDLVASRRFTCLLSLCCCLVFIQGFFGFSYECGALGL